MAQQKIKLKKNEIDLCQKMATRDDLHGVRAKALLAINDGDTHKVAAEKAGLKGGQMMYLARIFNKKGIAIFPKDEPKTQLENVTEEVKPQTEDSPLITTFEVDEIGGIVKSKKKSDKKDKKDKKKKKSKKKDKVKKQEKKSKKKKDKKKSDKKIKKDRKKNKSKKKK
jgi:hypothetical protein